MKNIWLDELVFISTISNMDVGNVRDNLVNVDLQISTNGKLGSHTLSQACSMSIENNTVTTQQTPTTKLDSRSAVIDKADITKIEDQINYTKNHPIKSFFGVKAKKDSLNIKLAKDFKVNEPRLNTIFNGGVDGKLLNKPKTWLQQDRDGQYSFMMQIQSGVSANAVNEQIEAFHTEAEKAAANSGGNIKIEGNILIINDGEKEIKIYLPVKGYPANYIMFTASNTTGSKGESNVTLVIPNTAESKKKFTEMSTSTDEQLKILQNIGKLYSQNTAIKDVIKTFEKYQEELRQICGNFSEKFNQENPGPAIKLPASMPNAEIITSLLNSAEALGITANTTIKTGTSITEYLNSQFTSFTSNAGNKIANSKFNPNTNPSTATVGGQSLAGNTCILYKKSQTEYELYTCKDGKFEKVTFKAENGVNDESDPTKINHHISMLLGELHKNGAEILLAKQGANELYTMGHGKELDLMITGKPEDGFIAKISDGGVDKWQVSSETKVVEAIQDIFSNLGKAGTKIDQLAKAKLEVAAMMIANREKYDNFTGNVKDTKGKTQNQVDKFIKDVLKQKYKTDISKEDYGKLTAFVATMAGKFTTTTTITKALENIEKGEKGEIEIPKIFEDKSLTIEFAEPKQLTDGKNTLVETKIANKAINFDATLNALTKAADPKFKKADKSGNATQFVDLSLSDKLKVLQQAQAKANLAQELVDLHAKEGSPVEYIKLLGKLAANQLLKDVEVKWQDTNKMSVQELTKNFAILLNACIKTENQQETFKSDTKLDKDSFKGNQQALDALNWLKTNYGELPDTAGKLLEYCTDKTTNDGYYDIDTSKFTTKVAIKEAFPGGVAKKIRPQLYGLRLQ